jgi:hypothetical protein
VKFTKDELTIRWLELKDHDEAKEVPETRKKIGRTRFLNFSRRPAGTRVKSKVPTRSKPATTMNI